MQDCRAELDDIATGGRSLGWSVGVFDAYSRAPAAAANRMSMTATGPLLSDLGIHGQYLFVPETAVSDCQSVIPRLAAGRSAHSLDIAGLSKLRPTLAGKPLRQTVASQGC